MPEQTAPAGATPAPGATPGQQSTDSSKQQSGQTETQPTSPQGNNGQQDPGMAAMNTDAGREALRQEREAREEAERKLRELQPRIEEFDKAQKAVAEANLTEVERRDRTIREHTDTIGSLQAENKSSKVQLASVGLATQLGFQNPALAYRLVDPARIEYADDGTPKNLKPLLEKVLETDPYLGRGGDFGGGQRGTQPSSSDMNTLLRRRGG